MLQAQLPRLTESNNAGFDFEDFVDARYRVIAQRRAEMLLIALIFRDSAGDIFLCVIRWAFCLGVR